MKRILKKGKVKGSVLFTTTGVMLVLVVFLMSTMVLASSANRRSYYTYYENQAQYAAQAALDAITNSAYSDGNFHQWIITDPGLNPPTGSAPTPQPITVDFTGSNIQFTNDNDSVTCYIEPTDSNYIWDDVTQAVHEQRAWKITATASVGNGKNASEYSVSNYIYENFHVDDPNALNTVQNEGHNRIYNYADGSGPITPPPITIPPTGGTLVPAILSLSASATNNNFVSLGTQYSNLSAFPRGRTRYEDAPAEYLVDTANNNYAVGNIIYFNNLHSAVLRNSTFQKFGESAVYYGDLYNENAGDIAGFRWAADISDAEVARMGGTIPYTSLPYVYVDGKMYANGHSGSRSNAQGGGFYIGYTTNLVAGNYPVNLFCGAVNASEANTDFAVLGDAYLYDPALDSVICSGRMENDSALKTFAVNNVQRANTQLANQTIGGNLYCNNHSLTLGQAKRMNIDGDLVFTNRQGTLSFTNAVHVKGRVICDGTITGRENLTADGGVFTGADASNYYDLAYNTYSVADYNDRADGTPLLPYSFRLDEIFQKYYRWDLFADSSEAAQANAANDSLVAESTAAGHSWTVQPFTITQDVVQYRYETNTNDPNWNWGAAYYDQTLGTMVMKIANGVTRTTTRAYVPYTEPRNGNAFIPGYEPVSPATALEAQTQTGALNFESVTAFDALLGSSAASYDQTNTPTRTDVPIVYHDANGNEQVSTYANAFVLNQSCTINLNNSTYNHANIFIDPKAGNHSESNPLVIKFVGGKIADFQGCFIVNNTANYDPNYTTATSYASQNTYAGRREVFIFFDNGFGAMSGKFPFVTTGAYDQYINENWRVVSNPIYPGQAGFDTLPAGIKYAYELVPNVAIFGEANGEYFFDNAAFFNADILMPNATIHNTNASNYKGYVEYREDPSSNPYNTNDKTPMVGVGCALVRIYDTGTNIAETVYIGDEGRGGTVQPPITPGIITSTTEEDVNGDNLGQEYQDHFSNHHRGT